MTTQASEAEIRRGKIIMFLKGRGNQGASISEITDALDMDKEDNGKLKMQLNRMLKDGELTQPKRGNYALPPEEIPQVKSEDNNEQETNQKESYANCADQKINPPVLPNPFIYVNSLCNFFFREQQNCFISFTGSLNLLLSFSFILLLL